MSKKVLSALIIIAVVVMVLIFNRGKVSVNLLFDEVEAIKSVAFFMFTVIGVVIGILLK